ncbi:MAG: rRNA maturation RNase YbeY [Kiloniellaceae bacterium]
MSDEPESTSLEIAVSVHDAAWLDALADLETQARSVVSATLAHLEVGSGSLEISLVFTDDAEQRELNRGYRQKDSATNVLSFPNMTDDGTADAGMPRLLGDVVLARETVAREAAAQGKSLADHSAHLLVHGTLHLLGYDHADAAEAAEMETLETEILATLGVADPYAGDAVAAGTAVAEEVSHG